MQSQSESSCPGSRYKACAVTSRLSSDAITGQPCVILFLSHLLIAGCDIGVQISVRPFVHPSTFTSKFGFLDIRDSCKSETLHSNCP